jgi:hypothetical protein
MLEAQLDVVDGQSTVRVVVVGDGNLVPHRFRLQSRCSLDAPDKGMEYVALNRTGFCGGWVS